MSTWPPPKSPLVVNSRTDKYDVFIGRPSRWGNPFLLGFTGGRLKVIRMFREWVLGQPEMVADIKRELRGKVLGCYCRPAYPCHGDVLAEIANEPDAV